MKNIAIRSILLFGLLLPLRVAAIGGAEYILTSRQTTSFELSVPGKTTTLCVSRKDYPGVLRAVGDLQEDLNRVTSRRPQILQDKFRGESSVIIGTVGKSPLVDKLIKQGKIHVEDLRGKWEHYLIQVVDKPAPGVKSALVIAGSDKRGTIYGIYDVSQKIGVSPWYWWADVPVRKSEQLYVVPGRYTEGPSVRYRGIFLNDEAPALSGWVHAKFGEVKPGVNPPVGRGVANYGREFYARIFELMLRIKANYLWPAMWGNAFNEDDPENPRLADEYGIVMGTSHQEPMVRSQQEWDRRYARTLGQWDYAKHPDVMEQFWREGIRRNKDYESIVTMGLRGANDSEMKGSLKDNIAMVEGIIQKQQAILKEEYKKPLEEIPQAWCLYKEINDYYNEGMKVPDNITLLWADDNWGYIRRLPDAAERLRKGGAGVYYHFDYHGGPRSYEWINTNPLPKIWDQMSLAKQYGADKIWIVNVGHFRGYELPMEYFMDLAWNTDRWTADNTQDYTRRWAGREFGTPFATDVAGILSDYARFNARRKPESLTPLTYSLVVENEADRVVDEYKTLADKADSIAKHIPAEAADAYYHLVQFPARIGAIVNELYVSAGKNQLYTAQGRASAGTMAQRTRQLFDADTAAMTWYNKVYAQGRWDHFMDQTHLGYTSWNPPRKNSLNALRLTEPAVPVTAGLGVAVEGSSNAWPGASGQAVLPDFDCYGGQTRWVEVFNRGKTPFEYSISCDVPWLKIPAGNGLLREDTRLTFTVKQDLLPEGRSKGNLIIRGAGQEVRVSVSGFKPSPMEVPYIQGFVQSNGLVSIEPEHFSRNTARGERMWLRVEDYGLSLSGMRATAPANAPAAQPGTDAPCLEYPVYLFSGDSIRVSLITSPVLNFMPGRPIQMAVSLNNDPVRYVTVVPASFSVQTSRSWGEGVLNQCRRLTTTLPVPVSGAQVLKVWMTDPGVVLQKIVLHRDEYPPLYLGPRESVFVK